MLSLAIYEYHNIDYVYIKINGCILNNMTAINMLEHKFTILKNITHISFTTQHSKMQMNSIVIITY